MDITSIIAKRLKNQERSWLTHVYLKGEHCLHTTITFFFEYASISVRVCLILQQVFYGTAYFGVGWFLLGDTLSNSIFIRLKIRIDVNIAISYRYLLHINDRTG